LVAIDLPKETNRPYGVDLTSEDDEDFISSGKEASVIALDYYSKSWIISPVLRGKT
jgi:hypothetical protein